MYWYMHLCQTCVCIMIKFPNSDCNVSVCLSVFLLLQLKIKGIHSNLFVVTPDSNPIFSSIVWVSEMTCCEQIKLLPFLTFVRGEEKESHHDHADRLTRHLGG